MQAIERHQVVIVCGETGSGKTTQLPKMALALGRAAPKSSVHPAKSNPNQSALGAGSDQSAQSAGKPNRASHLLIGHTQPRRIAATSVAKRIADELKTSLGELVGYKVRFQDKLSSTTRVKLMTDGILLGCGDYSGCNQ